MRRPAARLLVTRPAEDTEPLAGLLHAQGIETMAEPLIAIHYLDGPPPDLKGVQAILATSANGVRAFTRRSDVRDLPLFAVGDATAEAARAAGFRRVESAGGDVATLAALVGRRLDAGGGELLHVAGSHVAGDLAGRLAQAGFATRRLVLYEARAAERLGAEAAAAVRDGALDGVLFFSPRTAEAFAQHARAAGLAGACRRLQAFCLSAAVAEKAAALEWTGISVAECPEQESLIAAIETWRRRLRKD